jgi:protein tyrosine phosphatase
LTSFLELLQLDPLNSFNLTSFYSFQGPLDSTIVDFWHMTLQEESENVLMLCNIKEKGMDKCAQYWPIGVGEKSIYGDIEITNSKASPLLLEI